MRKRGHNSIGWCHETENPITGCEKGCPYCYVPRGKLRFAFPKGYKPTAAEIEAKKKEIMKPTFHPTRLKKIQKELATTEPSRVFVGSCADMFGSWIKPGADVTPDHVRQVLEVCAGLPQHRFLFLTKNPHGYGYYEIPENCWCGASTTGSSAELPRMDDFYRYAPEGQRFISLEPFTGPTPVGIKSDIDWLIVGGLTGKGAKKPTTEDLWKINLACDNYNIPLYVKSNAGSGPQEYPEGLRVE